MMKWEIWKITGLNVACTISQYWSRYCREDTKGLGRHFCPLLEAQLQEGKLLDYCLSEVKVQSACFLIAARELHSLWAFVFCRKWKRIELDYFSCAGLRSTKNSFWVNLVASHFDVASPPWLASFLKKISSAIHCFLKKVQTGSQQNLKTNSSDDHPLKMSLASSEFCPVRLLPGNQLSNSYCSVAFVFFCSVYLLCCCLVIQSFNLTLHDPMDWSTPGPPILH